MIKLGAIADLEEKAARLRNATRPISIHMIRCLTVLGVKMEIGRRDYETNDPRTASLIADTWANEPPQAGESVTVWTD